MRRQLVGLGVLMWMSAAPGWGATYFVSQHGGSDSGPCSQSAPCRTINGGLARMGGGDTLLVGSGTYDEQISDSGFNPGYRGTPPPSGSAGAYTTIKAATSGGATLRASRNGGDFAEMIILERASSHHIRIEGFMIESFGTCGSTFESHHIQFVNLECRGGGQGFTGSGMDIEFDGVRVHGVGGGKDGGKTCKGGSEPWAGMCHGFYFMKGAPTRITIRNSHLFNINGYAVQSYQLGVTVENTVMTDNFIGGVILVPHGGGVIRNNCFARQPTHIACTGCTQEGNRFDAECGAPPPPPRP